MSQKIERDHQRFRKIVRGKVKSNLGKYISRGEMIGKKGKDLVSIPLPTIDIPQFRYGRKGSGGVGQGQGDPGQPLTAPQGDGEAAGTVDFEAVPFESPDGLSDGIGNGSAAVIDHSSERLNRRS